MTRRLSIVWPDARPFKGRNGEPIRLLAVSDDVDRALEYPSNRESLGRIDAIVGCGDLEPGYLGFLGDAFRVPVAFVRGNHDRGGHWTEMAATAPRHLASGRLVDVSGITVAPFEWPGVGGDRAVRDEWRAWLDVLRAARSLVTRRLLRGNAPILVMSHAPPRGVGDCESDYYHLGYRGYRWLLERVRPPLWLHGHVTPATVVDWRARYRSSMVANVTGSVVVELTSPDAVGATDEMADQAALVRAPDDQEAEAVSPAADDQAVAAASSNSAPAARASSTSDSSASSV